MATFVWMTLQTVVLAVTRYSQRRGGERAPLLLRHGGSWYCSDHGIAREHYWRLVDEGVIGPDDRVELLEGVIASRSPRWPV
jgi:hypothetical protein